MVSEASPEERTRRVEKRGGSLALAIILGIVACAQGTFAGPPETRYVATIPPRSDDAVSGTDFARATTGWKGADRQQAIVDELLEGNLPGILRQLWPIRMTWTPPGAERPLEAVLWVMPDYLAVGSERDFLRVPLDFDSALRVANRFGFVLPTPKVVDAIYDQAVVKLEPQPKRPGPKMRSSVYYLEHQQEIERQLGTREQGVLIAGHKKDVVITNRLFTRPDRIAIYGWHQSKGHPIQPVSTIHGEKYADYSHGVRLVLATMSIDGRDASVLEVLQDPQLAPMLTYEGVIRDPRRLMSP